jgi:hypothetical protein
MGSLFQRYGGDNPSWGGMLDQCVKIQQLTTVIAVLVRLAGDDDISMNFLC